MPSLTRELKNLGWSWKHEEEGKALREDSKAGSATNPTGAREASETALLQVCLLRQMTERDRSDER
jgi:hypothetical protein